jgi:mersacidin/lichenicidin family type 2 lantibiotic
MSIANIIRAFKDPEYRKSLSDAERAQLPAHPAGIIDLTPVQLEAVVGGQKPTGTTTCGTSTCDIQC